MRQKPDVVGRVLARASWATRLDPPAVQKGVRTMTTTVRHHARAVPLLASPAVASLSALGALAGVALQQHASDNAPSAPSPPVASYPGSDVFDNQPAGPWWTHRGDRGPV